MPRLPLPIPRRQTSFSLTPGPLVNCAPAFSKRRGRAFITLAPPQALSRQSVCLEHMSPSCRRLDPNSERERTQREPRSRSVPSSPEYQLPSLGQTALATASGDEQFHLGRQSGAIWKGSAAAAKIKQLWADSAHFDEQPYRDRMDLVFVDTAHSYEYVRNDSGKALSMVRRGGRHRLARLLCLVSRCRAPPPRNRRALARASPGGDPSSYSRGAKGPGMTAPMQSSAEEK
jgi:hypothetical protein